MWKIDGTLTGTTTSGQCGPFQYGKNREFTCI